MLVDERHRFFARPAIRDPDSAAPGTWLVRSLPFPFRSGRRTNSAPHKHTSPRCSMISSKSTGYWSLVGEQWSSNFSTWPQRDSLPKAALDDLLQESHRRSRRHGAVLWWSGEPRSWSRRSRRHGLHRPAPVGRTRQRSGVGRRSEHWRIPRSMNQSCEARRAVRRAPASVAFVRSVNRSRHPQRPRRLRRRFLERFPQSCSRRSSTQPCPQAMGCERQPRLARRCARLAEAPVYR